MQFIMPSWLYQTLLVAYALVALFLMYKLLMNRRQYNTGQVLVMAVLLWFLPVLGPLVVGFALRTKSMRASMTA